MWGQSLPVLLKGENIRWGKRRWLALVLLLLALVLLLLALVLLLLTLVLLLLAPVLLPIICRQTPLSQSLWLLPQPR